MRRVIATTPTPTIAAAAAAARQARFASASLEELLAGNSPWSAALKEWVTRPSVVRESILRQGASAAEELAHELGALQDAVAERRPGATERVRAWLLERDDLQSLLLLCEKAGEKSEAWDGFLAAVQMLDAAAREYLPVFADARVEDSRLAELSWRDPAAWWGQVVC